MAINLALQEFEAIAETHFECDGGYQGTVGSVLEPKPLDAQVR